MREKTLMMPVCLLFQLLARSYEYSGGSYKISGRSIEKG